MMLNGIKIIIGDDYILARKKLKDGISAITEIKAYDKDADIIVVSSVGTQTQLKAAIEAGANDFIQKPLNAEQIHHIISSRFEGR